MITRQLTRPDGIAQPKEQLRDSGLGLFDDKVIDFMTEHSISELTIRYSSCPGILVRYAEED